MMGKVAVTVVVCVVESLVQQDKHHADSTFYHILLNTHVDTTVPYSPPGIGQVVRRARGRIDALVLCCVVFVTKEG